MRQLKIEGATSLYIRRLCEVFFGTLQETCREFYKAFPSEFSGCFSGICQDGVTPKSNVINIFIPPVANEDDLLLSLYDYVSELGKLLSHDGYVCSPEEKVILSLQFCVLKFWS